jgi:hypothetical protein
MRFSVLAGVSILAFSSVACLNRGYNSENSSVDVGTIRTDSPRSDWNYVWANFSVESFNNTADIERLTGIKKQFVMVAEKVYAEEGSRTNCVKQKAHFGFNDRIELRNQLCFSFWSHELKAQVGADQIKNDFETFCKGREFLGVSPVTSGSYRGLFYIPKKYWEKMSPSAIEQFLIVEKIHDLSAMNEGKKVELTPKSKITIEVPKDVFSREWEKIGLYDSFNELTTKEVQMQDMNSGKAWGKLFEALQPQVAEKIACPASFQPQW